MFTESTRDTPDVFDPSARAAQRKTFVINTSGPRDYIPPSLVGLARTVPNTGPLFELLESVITQHLIPALLGRSPPGEIERDILSLPCRLGGMGIFFPVSISAQFASSINITEALVSNIFFKDLLEIGSSVCPDSYAKFYIIVMIADNY